MVDHLAEQRAAPFGEFLVRVDVVEDPPVLVEDVEVLAADRLEDVAALAPLPVVHADPVQQGDPFGGDQGAERPGRVLVVPGREGEPGAGDEVAPVRLVPDDLEQVEQLRTVGEGEHVRAGVAEQVRPLIAADSAVPVRTGVVVDEHLGVVGGVEAVRYRGERTLRQGVVTVQEQDVVALRPFHPGVARASQPHVLGEVHHVDARVVPRVLVEDGPRTVRRAVVHCDELEVHVVLAEHRIEALGQVALHLVHRDDEGEPGHPCNLFEGGAVRALPRTVVGKPVMCGQG